MSGKSRRAAADHVPGPARIGRFNTGPVAVLALVGPFVAVGVAVGLRIWVGDDFRASTVSFACWVTSCSAPGMTFAGWLMTLTPLLYVGLMLLLFRRSTPPAKAALVALGVVLFLVVVNFLPGRNGPKLPELMRGPGSEAVVTGMHWGLGTLGLALVAVIALGALSAKVRLRPWMIAAALGTVGVVMLGAAMARAQPVVPGDTELLGPVLTVNDDVLTRTSIAERKRCEGILADDAPLDGCLRTREWGFTTSDSDAVVRFSAVMFADNDGAWDAWGEFRDSTRPAGISGDAIVVPEVTGEWLTVATVSHADGRVITEDEKKWLLWPAAQLRYAFAQAIDHSLATEPSPSGSVAPKS